LLHLVGGEAWSAILPLATASVCNGDLAWAAAKAFSMSSWLFWSSWHWLSSHSTSISILQRLSVSATPKRSRWSTRHNRLSFFWYLSFAASLQLGSTTTCTWVLATLPTTGWLSAGTAAAVLPAAPLVDTQIQGTGATTSSTVPGNAAAVALVSTMGTTASHAAPPPSFLAPPLAPPFAAFFPVMWSLLEELKTA
jgi:hypothetical protein